MKKVLNILLAFGVLSSSSLFALENEADRSFFNAVETHSFSDFSADGSQFVMTDYARGELWLYSLTDPKESPKKIVAMRSRDNLDQSIRVFSPKFSPRGDFLLFASLDRSLSHPRSAQLWRVNPDGSAFRTLTKTIVNPEQDPILAVDFLSFYLDGRMVLFPDFQVPEAESTLSSIDMAQEIASSFVWQKGILAWAWAPNQKHLAYLVKKHRGEENASSTLEFWVTRADGGQLRKSSDFIFDPKNANDLPISWSPDSRFISYFSERMGENRLLYRELEMQIPNGSTSQVVFRIDGIPHGQIKWSKNARKMAFIEEDQSAFKLVTLQVKMKKGLPAGAKKIRVASLPKDSVLLGFDAKDDDYLYVLMPVANDQSVFFDLVRLEGGESQGKIIASKIPPYLYYHFDEKRHALNFCTKTSGCQWVELPSGERRWLTPNYETTVAAGDDRVMMGDPQGGLKMYQSLESSQLERELWIGLNTRLYLAQKRAEKTEESEKIWQHLISEIDKGELPAQDYLRLAQGLSDLGENARAVEIYQKIQGVYPKAQETRDALFESGLVYRRMKEFDFARNCFANFVKFFPTDPRAVVALLELGETYLSLDQPAVALRVFRKVIGLGQRNEKEVRAFLGKARALERMSHFKEAVKTYQVVIERAQAGSFYDQEARAAISRLGNV